MLTAVRLLGCQAARRLNCQAAETASCQANLLLTAKLPGCRNFLLSFPIVIHNWRNKMVWCPIKGEMAPQSKTLPCVRLTNTFLFWWSRPSISLCNLLLPCITIKFSKHAIVPSIFAEKVKENKYNSICRLWVHMYVVNYVLISFCSTVYVHWLYMWV